jgi:hypothetical protein
MKSSHTVNMIALFLESKHSYQLIRGLIVLIKWMEV